MDRSRHRSRHATTQLKRLRPGAFWWLAGLLWVIAASGTWPGMQRHEPVAYQPPLETQCLDINRASEREWRSLPGIGPVLAKRIVECRQQQGKFGSTDELLRVRGIGLHKLDRIRSQLVLPAAAPCRPSRPPRGDP